RGRAAEMAAWGLWLLHAWARAAAAAPPPPPDAEVTFVLPAGRRECFYQGAPGNASLEAEYQVPAGAGPKPGLGTGRGRGLGTGRVGAEVGRPLGPWLTRWPMVALSCCPTLTLLPPSTPHPSPLHPPWGLSLPTPHPTSLPLSPFQESIETMRSRLERSIQMQTALRAFEARDRNLQESNLGRVNFWSAVNLGVLVVVAFLQVCLLKSLFEDKRTVRT
ncbi:TMED1 protein, partial [Podargus strigoides]|nr:TMED1 protein [Podargus strigoides]